MVEASKPLTGEIPTNQPKLIQSPEGVRDALILLTREDRLSLKSVIEAIQPDLTPDDEKQLACQVAQWFSELKNRPKPLTEAALAPGPADQSNQSKVCLIPSETHSIRPRDHTYYSDPYSLKADFEAFAREWEEQGAQGATPLYINTANLGFLFITCANGEKNVNGRNWLIDASIALSENKDGHDLRCKLAFVLDELKRKIGFYIPEKKINLPKDKIMNYSYFQENKNILFDLKAFAKESGCKTIKELNLYKMMNAKKVLCANGERIWGGTYIYRAAVGLEMAGNLTEAKKVDKVAVLNKLINKNRKVCQ